MKPNGHALDDATVREAEQQMAAELLHDVFDHVRRYVALSDAQARIIALWILHTYCYTQFDDTPYLNVSSAEKQCGKTRLLETLELVVSKPWLTGRTTPACLVRKIDADKPTLLLDETDTAFKSGEEYSESLRGILNSGYRRTGVYSCCVPKGREMTFADFSCFCPKALAGIGELPGTIADRSIPIRLKRRSTQEPVERFRRAAVEELSKPLRERMKKWVKANTKALEEATPECPDALSDRQQDVCSPLLAIADLAGQRSAEHARNALVEIFGSSAADDQAIGVRLLGDIRRVFDTASAVKEDESISSKDLVAALLEIELAPWAEFGRQGKPISARTLVRLLRPFDIIPRSVRSGKTEQFRGYKREWFEDAWSRYLPVEKDPPEPSSPSSPPSNVSHVSQANNGAGQTHFLDVSQKDAGTDEKSEESPIDTRVGTHGTDKTPGTREKEGEPRVKGEL